MNKRPPHPTLGGLRVVLPVLLGLVVLVVVVEGLRIGPTAQADSPRPEAFAGWAEAEPIRHETVDGTKYVAWYEGSHLLVEGKGWEDTPALWHRLPQHAKATVPERVWEYSQRSAGLAVRFATDSREVHAIWSGGKGMQHMPPSSVSGLDLYYREGAGESWRFAGIGPPIDGISIATLHEREEGEEGFLEYLLFLPLFNELTRLEIAVLADASVLVPPADTRKPFVFYGTSVTQGACASRTGMAYPAILRRWYDRPTVNLGFSGSGKMEVELAELLAELDAEIYVVNCMPNMINSEIVEERAEPFLRRLSELRPEIPILVVEDHRPKDRNKLLRAAFDRVVADGAENLHYLPRAPMVEGDEDGTVDGLHPTDLGFLRIATAMRDAIDEILRD